MGGSRWGTRVHPWLTHANVWQKTPEYCKVISLQLKFFKKFTHKKNFSEPAYLSSKKKKKAGIDRYLLLLPALKSSFSPDPNKPEMNILNRFLKSKP